MNDIVILGCGKFSREVAFLIEQINVETPLWKILGHVSQSKDDVGKRVGKYTVLCSDGELPQRNIHAVMGFGNPKYLRETGCRFTNEHSIAFPNIVHPKTVWDRERIEIGTGNVICAGNIFTTDITIGCFNVFNLGGTYGHDVVIEDYCVLSPGVNCSGGVKIGSGCLIGAGAVILPDLRIGGQSTVAAGSVVVRDVPEGVTVFGNPARIVKGL